MMKELSKGTRKEDTAERRISFELFKSNVCHRVKDIGDRPFIIETLESGEIVKYYQKRWYLESLYLLAMVDYLCRVNGLPICSDYDGIRRHKMSKRIYPSSALIASAITEDSHYMDDCWEQAIPEFKRFNIVEGDIRNVI